MNLIEQVNAGIITAMKAKETDRLRALRGIKSAFLLLQTGEGVTEVTDEMCIKALQKLAKQRKDSLEIYQTQGREDLASVESSELTIIEEFLPAQMSEADVRAKIQEVIDLTTSIQNEAANFIQKYTDISSLASLVNLSSSDPCFKLGSTINGSLVSSDFLNAVRGGTPTGFGSYR